jgi:hypothetical protein
VKKVVYDYRMNTTSPSLEAFVDRLLDEKGLEGLDAEVLAQVRTDLMSRLEDRVNAAILAHMPEDQLPAFLKVLDSGDSAEIQKFCVKHVPSLDEVVATELLGFRETYVGG